MSKWLKDIWHSPLTGAVGGLVIAFWEALWFMGPLLGYDPPERQLYLLIGFVAFVGFVAHAFWTQRRRIRELELQHQELKEKFLPKLKIVFLPENDSDSRPYLQTLNFGRPSGVGMPVIEMIDRRFRVGVRNASDSTVPSVSLRLESCEPSGNFVFPEHELAVQDTNPPAGSCEIQPHETRWFDVVNECGPASHVPKDFHFCYRNQDFSGLPVPFGTYNITLRAEGGGPSVKQEFLIAKNRKDSQVVDSLMFEEVSPSGPGLYDHAINASEAPGRVTKAILDLGNTIERINEKLLNHANIIGPVTNFRQRRMLVAAFAQDVTPDVMVLGQISTQLAKDCALICNSYQHVFAKVQIRGRQDRKGLLTERDKFTTLGRNLSGGIKALERRRDLMMPLGDILPVVSDQYAQAMTTAINPLKDLQDFSSNAVRTIINKRVGLATRLLAALSRSRR